MDRRLGPLGYQHFTVNHSVDFVDEEIGFNTNHIEETWNGLKQNISARHRTREYIKEMLTSLNGEESMMEICGRAYKVYETCLF